MIQLKLKCLNTFLFLTPPIFMYLVSFYLSVLQNAFQEKNNQIVQNTIRHLPLQIVAPLIKEVCRHLTDNPQR